MDNFLNLALYRLDRDLIANEALIDVSGASKIKDKVQNALLNICNALMGFINALIKAVTNFIGVFRTSFRACMKNTIITDTFGYIDCITAATPFIREYFILLDDTRILDQKINTTYSVADGIKDKITDNTIRVSSKSETRRAYHEQVILNLDKADDLKDKLEKMLDRIISNPRAELNPKKYSIDVLDRVIYSNLVGTKTNLERLNEKLEVSRRLYQDKNFIYNFLHSEDIKRNETLLKHTSSLMQITRKYIDLYGKVMEHVDNIKV